MRRCRVQEITKAVPEAQTLTLPKGWLESLGLSTDVFNAMYDWMLSERKVPDDSKAFLPNRTYVGDRLYEKLRAAERKRLRTKLKITGEELEATLSWSEINSSPKTEICGVTIAGDVILVIPESSRGALNAFAVRVAREARATEVKKVKARAAGATYYQWLVSQIDRPDRIGDTAREAAIDDDYPRESNDYYELRSYLDSNACYAAIKCFEEGWLEYLQQYPGRANPMAWCSECDKRLDTEDALLAWSTDTGEIYVLDSRCLQKYMAFDEMAHRPLAGISLVDLEALVEAGISDFDMEKLSLNLKLWGVLPPADEGGLVYFIRAEDTHRIKIGFTSGHVENRKRNLQTSNAGDLTVLATIKGTREYEKDLHGRFSQYRLNGEWFEPHPDLLAFISLLGKRE